MNKKALILVNVGTPDDPSVRSVRRYLRAFLNDPKVIDIPPLLRKILVNLVIVPFRAPRSAAKYRELWTDLGSPLLLHMEQLVGKLEKRTGEDTDVYGMMRYGRPALSEILREIGPGQYERIAVLPLYPQFAESTTGTVLSMASDILRLKIKGSADKNGGTTDYILEGTAADAEHQQEWIQSAGKINKAQGPNEKSGLAGTVVRIIEQFYEHPGYLEAMKNVILEQEPGRFDHVLFSYHGLPMRQVQKCHPDVPVESCNCEAEMPAYGTRCYQAACYATTRLLAERTGLKPGTFSTAFQSRLSKNWMSPFTDKTLKELAATGKKRVLVIPASFVADCLETTFEIGLEYSELFLEAGGTELVMTPSLNAKDEWVEGILGIVEG